MVRLRARLLTVAVLIPLALAAPFAAAARPVRRARQRVFVMGFDGMDPTLVRRFMAEGKLPNLKRLAQDGTFLPLTSSVPSDSPVAWATFATGVNPGNHNIYGFLVRDPKTYMPDLSMLEVQPAGFLWGWIPFKRPQITSTRGGTSFWVHAGRDGIRSVVLTVPVTFPPEKVPNGELLAGLPLPDMRGTVGTYSYWATDMPGVEQASSDSGGSLRPLRFENGIARTLLRGPMNPVVMQEEKELRAAEARGEAIPEERQAALDRRRDVTLPFDVRWQPGADRAQIEIQGQTLTLRTGEWSPWLSLSFRVNALLSLHGIAQFHLLRADRELALYASPISFDPRQSALPLSEPAGFAPRLVREVGLFRTIGQAESADKPLKDGKLGEGAFMHDAERAFEDRERIILRSLERDDWDLLVAAIESTDRVQHMMWRLIDRRHPGYDAALAARYGDSIERIYRKCDALVGRLLARLPAGAAFILMSDHGFHSFRRSVNLNAWLIRNGYMAHHGQTTRQKTMFEIRDRGQVWQGVDWSHTRAYALGIGQIYVNLRGRESHGIVAPGAEYRALVEELATKLTALQDPQNGARPLRAVYRRDEIYHGRYLAAAPDLTTGFDDGYRVGWQDTVGSIRSEVFEDNDSRWSGDHCGSAADISAGVFFSNTKLHDGTSAPRLLDIAPTVLRLLDVPLPRELEGRPLL